MVLWGVQNRMLNGYLLRDVIKKVNCIRLGLYCVTYATYVIYDFYDRWHDIELVDLAGQLNASSFDFWVA